MQSLAFNLYHPSTQRIRPDILPIQTQVFYTVISRSSHVIGGDFLTKTVDLLIKLCFYFKYCNISATVCLSTSFLSCSIAYITKYPSVGVTSIGANE